MSVGFIARAIFFIALMLGVQPALADELRPSYIEFNQISERDWSLTWKASARSSLGRDGSVLLPENCSLEAYYKVKHSRGNLIRTAAVSCQFEIEGQTIGLQGLEKSSTDALLRIKPLNSEIVTLRLTPNLSQVVIPKLEEGAQHNVVSAYFGLGVEHILFGYDHLLFVLCLVLLLSGWKTIVWTITAFTISHSISLIGSTLGLFGLPQKPVEAIIALSIVFLALEIVKSKPEQVRFSERHPWAVAFLFGLLHGFGFAGALAEIGLPKTDVPMALLSFNLGVEIGQLLIVIVALILLNALSKIWPSRVRTFKLYLAYVIGSLSMYWLLARILG